MTKKPTQAQLIQIGVDLLRSGLLASNLGPKLMELHDLTPARARKIAQLAMERWKPEEAGEGNGD